MKRTTGQKYTARKDYPTEAAPGAPQDHHFDDLHRAIEFAFDYVILTGAESVTVTGGAEQSRKSVVLLNVTKGEGGSVNISGSYATVKEN